MANNRLVSIRQASIRMANNRLVNTRQASIRMPCISHKPQNSIEGRLRRRETVIQTAEDS